MDKSKYQYTEEDFLDADQPIPGQNFVCLSFISPEKILKRKDLFYVKHFLHDLLNDTLKRVDIFLITDFLQSLFNDKEKREKLFSNGENISRETIEGKYLEFLNANQDLLKEKRIPYERVDDMYQTFLMKNEAKIQEKFNEEVDFQTNVRSLKVRGVYESKKEAQARATMLSRRDKNFSVFIAQCGAWLPWDPTEDKIDDQEYAEKELNELMKKYKENSEARDTFYEEQKREKLATARKDNEERRKKLMEENKLKEKPTTTDTDEESKKKIAELRGIADEKARVLFSDPKAKTDDANKSDADLKKEENAALFEKPDAWLQRKMELEEEKRKAEKAKEEQQDVKTGKQEADKKIDEIVTKIL